MQTPTPADAPSAGLFLRVPRHSRCAKSAPRASAPSLLTSPMIFADTLGHERADPRSRRRLHWPGEPPATCSARTQARSARGIASLRKRSALRKHARSTRHRRSGFGGRIPGPPHTSTRQQRASLLHQSGDAKRSCHFHRPRPRPRRQGLTRPLFRNPPSNGQAPRPLLTQTSAASTCRLRSRCRQTASSGLRRLAP